METDLEVLQKTGGITIMQPIEAQAAQAADNLTDAVQTAIRNRPPEAPVEDPPTRPNLANGTPTPPGGIPTRSTGPLPRATTPPPPEPTPPQQKPDMSAFAKAQARFIYEQTRFLQMSQTATGQDLLNLTTRYSREQTLMMLAQTDLLSQLGLI